MICGWKKTGDSVRRDRRKDFALGYSGVTEIDQMGKALENKFQNIILDIYLMINFKILKLIWLPQ